MALVSIYKYLRRKEGMKGHLEGKTKKLRNLGRKHKR
jgi:hypothetical protein